MTRIQSLIFIFLISIGACTRHKFNFTNDGIKDSLESSESIRSYDVREVLGTTFDLPKPLEKKMKVSCIEYNNEKGLKCKLSGINNPKGDWILNGISLSPLCRNSSSCNFSGLIGGIYFIKFETINSGKIASSNVFTFYAKNKTNSFGVIGASVN